MIGTKRPALRISGSGEHLRLHLASGPDSLATVRECCRAATAVDKALGEAIRGAVAAGHSWTEIGHALGVEANSSMGVKEEYEAARRWIWSRFWGGESTR